MVDQTLVLAYITHKHTYGCVSKPVGHPGADFLSSHIYYSRILIVGYGYHIYSLKLLRVKFFKDFCLASKILSFKFLVLHRHLLLKAQKFYHEKLFLTEKSLNLEIFLSGYMVYILTD